MKKIGLLIVALGVFVSAGSAFAKESTQSWDPTLIQAKSCKEVEGMFKEYFNVNWNGGYFGPVQRGGVMMNDSATKAAVEVGGIGGGGGDVSATNNQKTGVDEPDIVKNDGKYIYYLDGNNLNHQIHIVSATSVGKEESTIVIPQDMWNTQIFLYQGKLIVIGGKSAPYSTYQTSMIARDQKAMVMIYDVSNVKAPKLLSAYEYDGYVQESRLVDNKLVLVTSQGFTRGPVYMMRDKMMQTSTAQSIKSTDFTFKASDLLPSWTSMQPSVISKNGTQKVTTVKKTSQVDCTNVLYKKPDARGNGYPYWGQTLTSIITFVLDTPRVAPSMKTILGNTAQIHVTRNTLYLTAPSYINAPMSCPINARCIMPMWSQGTYTTIHQFGLSGLRYNYSTAVKGTTYNQYSMDDTNGQFRIVTSDTTDPQSRVATNVYVIDSQGKIAGKLEHIAPGEQFQGTRFIDNYLYLVTYRQIDPLFVISLADVTKPTIVGQLKMPGYSVYLHPYGPKQGNIQYLIGLGFDTSLDTYGNERQGGVKIDLYKADFSQKDKAGNITVAQVWTKTFGDQGSQSDAIYNPRMFMFNQTTKELLMPLVIATTQKTQQCNVIYDTNGKEIRKECYPQEMAVTQFAGLKGWTIGTDAIKETLSLDYRDTMKSAYGYGVPASDPWMLSSLQPRVGYIGDTYYFITNQFAHLFSKTNQKGVMVQFPFTGATNFPESVTPPVSPLKAE